MEEKIFCSVCGAKLTEETATEFEGQIFCEDCFDEAVTVCDCCGRRIWRSDATENDSITLCDSCYDYNYTHCDECGRLIHNDDAFYEDESDYDNAIILYTHYKGQQITFPIKLFKSEYISKILKKQYDGTNAKKLARTYGYSERWIKELVRRG